MTNFYLHNTNNAHMSTIYSLPVLFGFLNIYKAHLSKPWISAIHDTLQWRQRHVVYTNTLRRLHWWSRWHNICGTKKNGDKSPSFEISLFPL